MRIRVGNKEENILKSAVNIFAKEGFYKAKIVDIAEKAGVATGSVYLYFKSKEDILLMIFENIWSFMHNKLEYIVRDKNLSPVDKFDAMIDLIFDTFSANPDTAVVIANEQMNLVINNKKFTRYYEMFLDIGETIIKEGIVQKVFTPNIEMNIVRHYILGAFRDLITNWAVTPEEYDLSLIRKNIKQMTLYGLQYRDE